MENYDINNIEDLNLEELPSSSYNILLGKRRSGKSYLCEYVVKKLIDMGECDMCFLFSETLAGFDFIKYDFRYKEIDELRNLVAKYKYMNNYNKLVGERSKIKLKTIVIIDDCAIKLKSKEFNILEELSVNGRHSAYPPLSLHFFILAQSLTKIPRVCRLNCDNIFLNAIASEHERAMVLDENMYLIDGSRQGKNMGRSLYQSLVASDDFVFMVIENWRQNATEYKHYIKKIKAD
jgi:hypothetical protein